MVVCAFIFIDVISGVITCIIVFGIFYSMVMAYIYSRNKNYMPRNWVIFNTTAVSISFVAIFFASWFIPQLPVFLGFSISVWLFSGLFLAYGYWQLYSDYMIIH